MRYLKFELRIYIIHTTLEKWLRVGPTFFFSCAHRSNFKFKFFLRRLYSFISIIICSPSTFCCSSLKEQKNIFNIFLCFTTFLLQTAISRHGKNPIIWYISVQSFIIPFHLSWVDFFSVTMELYVSSYCDSISESFTYNPNFTTRQRWHHTYLTRRSRR